MKLTESSTILSASDLVAYADCQSITKLSYKVATKVIPAPVKFPSPLLDILQDRGRDHEKGFVEKLVTDEGKAEGQKLPDLTSVIHSASDLIKQQNKAFTFLRDQFVELSHRLLQFGAVKHMDTVEKKPLGSFWKDLLKVGQDAGKRFPLINAAKNMYTFLRNQEDWEQHKHPERTRGRTRTPFS